MRRLLPSLCAVAIVLVALLVPPVLATAARGPAPGAPVIVLAPPWAEAGALIARAGGVPLPPVVGLPLGYSPDPNFVGRLRAAGAWAVLDASAGGMLCAP
jgi:hypothetical protein